MLATLHATVPPGLAHEVVLVDNGSTDGTAEWLQMLAEPPFRIVRSDRNLGYAGANNLAVRQTHGGVVVLLNNDLVLLPGWLAPMIELAGKPGVGIVGNTQLSVKNRGIDHAGIFFDQAGQPFHFRPAAESLGNLTEIEAPAVTGACMAISQKLFQEIGGFDEGYRNGYEDIDLCLRALQGGYRNVVAAQSVVYHHIGTSAGRHDAEVANAARLQARWGGFAKMLSKLKPPTLVPSQKGPRIRSISDAYATFQAYHPGAAGHSEARSTVQLYPAGTRARVRIPAPSGAAGLRLDPSNCPGTIQIEALELKEAKSGKVVWSAKADILAAVLVVSGTAVLRSGSGPPLTVESTGNDPQLEIRSDALPPELRERRDLMLEILIQTQVASAG